MSSIKEFDIIKHLGKGSFSNVYKVRRKTDGQIYAMKQVKLPKLSHKERQNSLNEIRILASITHPYIVSYKDAFYDNSQRVLCIVMEFAGSGDLLNKVKSLKQRRKFLPEDRVWTYLIQMTKAIKTLHDMKILHRDLKSANIFLSEDEQSIKLGDLNVSKVCKNIQFNQTQTGKRPLSDFRDALLRQPRSLAGSAVRDQERYVEPRMRAVRNDRVRAAVQGPRHARAVQKDPERPPEKDPPQILG
jgi:NIMA (never in mitosis gene a)-related kinase 1/4/5